MAEEVEGRREDGVRIGVESGEALEETRGAEAGEMVIWVAVAGEGGTEGLRLRWRW